MANFNIDGRDFSGRNITIRNGIVTIDGHTIEGSLSGVVEIKITEGVVEHLTTDANVSCLDIHGNAQAGGNISSDDIRGDAQAGGNISCDDIGGRAIAGGNISGGR